MGVTVFGCLILAKLHFMDGKPGYGWASMATAFAAMVAWTVLLLSGS